MTRDNLEPLDPVALRVWCAAHLEDDLRPVALAVLSLLSRMAEDDWIVSAARDLAELEPTTEAWWRAYHRLSRRS